MNGDNHRMKLLNRKNRWQRLVGTVNDSVDMPSAIKSALPSRGSGNSLKSGLPSVGSGNSLKSALPGVGSGNAMKTGLMAAAGLAGLTAASARVSSLRRQKEGARDGS